jgi:fucose 4-O-acetylase-like acetyltransferase
VNKATQNRIPWIDTIKGIGILLVVLIHCLPATFVVRVWISTFIMPMFFMLSGYVYSPDRSQDIKAYILKKAKSLLLPYFFYSLICIPLYIAEGSNTVADVLACLFMYKGQAIWNAPLRFLFTLFFIEVVFAICRVNGKLFKTVACAILFFAAGYVLNKLLGFRYFGADKIVIGLFFYSAGYAVRSSGLMAIAAKKRLSALLICALFVVSVFVGVYVNWPKTNFYQSVLNNYFYYTVGAIAGSLFIIIACAAFYNRRPNGYLSVIGMNTIFILSTHYIIVTAYQRFVNAGYDTVSPKSVVVGVILAIVLSALYYPVIKLAEKFTPILLFRKSTKEGNVSRIK